MNSDVVYLEKLLRGQQATFVAFEFFVEALVGWIIQEQVSVELVTNIFRLLDKDCIVRDVSLVVSWIHVGRFDLSLCGSRVCTWTHDGLIRRNHF